MTTVAWLVAVGLLLAAAAVVAFVLLHRYRRPTITRPLAAQVYGAGTRGTFLFGLGIVVWALSFEAPTLTLSFLGEEEGNFIVRGLGSGLCGAGISVTVIPLFVHLRDRRSDRPGRRGEHSG